MISIATVAKVVYEQDKQAGRNVDRPKSYIIQKWVEMNRIDVNKALKDHAKFLKEVEKLKKSSPAPNVRKGKSEELVLEYLTKNHGFASLKKIQANLGIPHSTCCAALLSLYRAGVLERKSSEYALIVKKVAA